MHKLNVKARAYNLLYLVAVAFAEVAVSSLATSRHHAEENGAFASAARAATIRVNPGDHGVKNYLHDSDGYFSSTEVRKLKSTPQVKG